MQLESNKTSFARTTWNIVSTICVAATAIGLFMFMKGDLLFLKQIFSGGGTDDPIIMAGGSMRLIGSGKLHKKSGNDNEADHVDAHAGGLLARWQRGGIEAISITSAEGLANFFDLLGPTGSGYLRATPVFVPHPRIALAARKLDVREIVVTGRGDDRTVAEMAAFFAKV